TAYKSYSIPADVPGVFAVSHANVWRCGLNVTPVPPQYTQIGPLGEVAQRYSVSACSLILACRACPTARGKVHRCASDWCSGRGFPTDFPVVGCERRNVLDASRPARDYALSAMAVEWKDEVACVGQHDGDARRSYMPPALVKVADGLSREPRGLVRC